MDMLAQSISIEIKPTAQDRPDSQVWPTMYRPVPVVSEQARPLAPHAVYADGGTKWPSLKGRVN